MTETYLATIVGMGRGGDAQFVPIPLEVSALEKTSKGDKVRITLEKIVEES
jgi:hypothetical protein